MSATPLRARLDQAGLTVEQFAEIVGVDPKTVQRWLGGRTPYRRHRATIARALDTPEHVLWPDDVPAPTPAPEPAAAPAPSVFGEELVGFWAHSDGRGPGMPNLRTIVDGAHERIDVIDGG